MARDPPLRFWMTRTRAGSLDSILMRSRIVFLCRLAEARPLEQIPSLPPLGVLICNLGGGNRSRTKTSLHGYLKKEDDFVIGKIKLCFKSNLLPIQKVLTGRKVGVVSLPPPSVSSSLAEFAPGERDRMRQLLQPTLPGSRRLSLRARLYLFPQVPESSSAHDEQYPVNCLTSPLSPSLPWPSTLG